MEVEKGRQRDPPKFRSVTLGPTVLSNMKMKPTGPTARLRCVSLIHVPVRGVLRLGVAVYRSSDATISPGHMDMTALQTLLNGRAAWPAIR